MRKTQKSNKITGYSLEPRVMPGVVPGLAIGSDGQIVFFTVFFA